MKKISLLIGFLFVSILVEAQDSHYYYYENEKQYLTLNTEYAFLSLEEVGISDNINQFVLSIDSLRSDGSANKQFRSKAGKNRFYTELKFQEQLTTEQYFAKITSIKQLYPKAIVSPYFKMSSDEKIGLSNFFYVKLKAESDTTLLLQMSEQENCIIIEQDQFMPLWFVLSTTELSELNAMETANIFYESGHFAAAEPNLMPDKIRMTNDTYYSQQWGLSNTGQYGGTNGIDIKAVNAWNISTGSNVKVAVIDEGIDLTHPDLAGNIDSQSYDTQNRTSPSIIRGSHGTACAGIIGAIQNNNQGISGVTPNCILMSISRQLNNVYDMLTVQQDLAAGINWAWQNGADVISNSWGHNALQGSYITDAINNAVTQGRSGKGCVVVFASGNNNASSVSYPASLSNVIAVGAVSPCGQRKSPTSCDGETTWGSNYGANLDVVAPGVLIPTTDIQGSAGYNEASGTAGNYYASFNGTSAACPHVAGVAALILSVRPDLTQAQVRQAIESTCTKLLGYSFSTNSNHPNGRWNNQVGHGLVDAYAALRSLFKFDISGPKHFCSSATYTIPELPSSYTVEWTVRRESAPSSSDDQALLVTTTTYNTRDLSLSGLSGFSQGLSATYYITATISGSTFNNIKIYYTVVSGAPSPYTGYISWTNSSDGQSGETTNQSHGNTLILSSNSSVYLYHLYYQDNTYNDSYVDNSILFEASCDGNIIDSEPGGPGLSIYTPPCSYSYGAYSTYIKLVGKNSCGKSLNTFYIPVVVTSGSSSIISQK
jgi:subtilisin family serine protease